MEESLGMTKTQAKSLMKYISDNMKIPVIGNGGGSAFLGQYAWSPDYVTSAPVGWLICDGSTHLISDYPEYAALLASQHGSSNCYGGDGVTTFAVIDLRGEFPRGAGTNSHANQGNGANPGVHQNGTSLPTTFTANGTYIYSYKNGNNGSNAPTDMDKKNTFSDAYVTYASGTSATDNQAYNFTTRPTNTSGTFFVRVTVPGNPNGHNYSTDEQIVGTWIDGSILYEKTIAIVTPTVISGSATNTYTVASNIEKVIDIQGYFSSTNQAGGSYNMLPARTILSGNDLHAVNAYFANNLLVIESSSSAVGNRSGYATVRYTKTTDQWQTV